MAHLLLVRHGQASLGAEDYDQLSPLGQQQCMALGRWLRARRPPFEAVLVGGLRRHRQSLQALEEGWGEVLPAAHICPSLNEYDSQALLHALNPGPLEAPTSPEAAKQHFRHLRAALLAWMAGHIQPVGMPTHAEFLAGAQAAVAAVQAVAGPVLVVTSGGPISHLVGALLQAPPAQTVDLNMYLRNASVTEVLQGRQRGSLLSFNSVAHLEEPGQEGWVTHA